MSLETTSSHIPSRPRRRTWLLALPLGAAVLVASLSVAYGQRPASTATGDAPRGGAMEGFAARRLERMLDKVNATPGQRGQIHAIWDGLRPQLRELRTQHGALRKQIAAAVTAPTINAADVEKLRQQSLVISDRQSALFTQGLVASAQVLTVEQRKLAQDEMAKHASGHFGRRFGGHFRGADAQ